ncbi:MAG: alpha/beta hydrolase [Chloroflexota bacterium]
MTIHTHETTVNGRTVHYMKAGSGKPMVLLHGNIGDAAFHWSKILPELALDFTVYAPDLPDYGKSAPLPRQSFAATVDWLKGFFDALHLESAAIVGTSHGALIARLFAAAYPDAVPALIMISGGSLPAKSPGMAKLLARLPIVNNMIFGGASKQMVESREALQWFVQYPKPEVVDPNANTEYASSGRGEKRDDPLDNNMVTTAADSATSLSRLMRTLVLSPVPTATTPPVPTLIMWGENDEISPLKMGQRLQNALPGAQLEPIGDTRSAPHIEEPDIVAFQIAQFIRDLDKPQKQDIPGAGMLG